MKTYLSFESEQEYYGISTDDVVEIVQDMQIRSIPRSNDYVYGITKFRDEFIVVLDLFQLLNKDKKVERSLRNIVVVDVRYEDRDLRVGLNVDSIDNVIEINEDSIQTSDKNSEWSNFIHGIHHEKERFVFLLKNNMLVDSDEVEFLLDLNDKSVVKQEEIASKNEKKSEINTFLTFSLAGEHIAFPALMVKEVINEYDITSIALSNEMLEGIINLRGSIVPVININKKFGVNNDADKPVIAIMEMKLKEGTVLVGALMDKVNDVLDIPIDQIENQNVIDCTYNPEFVKGVYHIDDNYIRVVNVVKLLSMEQVELVG